MLRVVKSVQDALVTAEPQEGRGDMEGCYIQERHRKSQATFTESLTKMVQLVSQKEIRSCMKAFGSTGSPF